MDSDKAVWTMWGRQVRPGSLVLSIVTAALGANALYGRTSLTGGWEIAAGIAAIIASIALWAGWWRQCIHCAAVGYLLCVWTWTMVALTRGGQGGGWTSQTVISAGGFALLAGLLWIRDRRET